MTNNDILRRLRFAFNLNEAQIVQIISNLGQKTEITLVTQWLKREEDHHFQPISDTSLCQFLDGLIIQKRGHRPDGTIPQPLQKLTTNEILKKLRIALTLREQAMLAVFKTVDFNITKAELGSFFRNPNQRNFAKCPEQVLRKFIQGLSKQTKT